VRFGIVKVYLEKECRKIKFIYNIYNIHVLWMIPSPVHTAGTQKPGSICRDIDLQLEYIVCSWREDEGQPERGKPISYTGKIIDHCFNEAYDILPIIPSPLV
jgi:hypothetical protein